MEPDCHGGSGTRSQTSFNYGPKQPLTDGQVTFTSIVLMVMCEILMQVNYTEFQLTVQEFVVILNIEHLQFYKC